MNLIPKDIQELGTHEKLQLVEDLWDSLEETWAPELSSAVKAELDRRAAYADAHPGQGKTLAEIALSLGVRL